MREHFAKKDYVTLKDMDPQSEDIQSHSLVTHCQDRPRALENYSFADFTSQLRNEYP